MMKPLVPWDASANVTLERSIGAHAENVASVSLDLAISRSTKKRIPVPGSVPTLTVDTTLKAGLHRKNVNVT